MRKLLSFTLFALLTGRAFAGADPEAGANSFDFLSLSTGSRPVAMAGAYTAEDGDLYAFTYNPAGLATVKRNAVVLDYMYYVLDMQRGLLGFALNRDQLKNIGVMGAYVNYFHAGNFEAVDPEGNRTPEDDFTAGSTEFGISFARDAAFVPNVPMGYGVTLKWVTDRIADYRNDAVGMDAGVQANFVRKRIKVGAAVRNFGGSGTFHIPRSYALGASYATRAVNQTLFMLDLNQPAEGLYTLRLGAEYRVSRDFFLRGGYRFLQPELEYWYHSLKGGKEDYVRDEFNTWSAGLGFKAARRLIMDIAVQGTTFQPRPLIQVSLNYTFQKSAP